MKDNPDMEKLLNKLKNSELDVNEIKELFKNFKENEISGEVDKYFLRIWDTSSRTNNELNSDEMLTNVHKRLGLSEHNDHYNPVKTILYKIVLKYAAVLILVFAVSFLLGRKSNHSNGYNELLTTGNHEVAVSYGSKTQIKLPDGTIVRLNSGSKLTYPAVFASGKRNVSLEGEAFFEVRADSVNPFYVQASDVSIRVTGTAFNVKSYAESNTIETTLVSGSLEITGGGLKSRNHEKEKTSLFLKPNQKAVYIKDMNRLTVDDRRELQFENRTVQAPKLTLVDKVDIQPLTAWKDNKLIFKNERFEDLCIKLERWYNVKITLKNKELQKERFTGTFENETIQQVLEAMKIAAPFEYNIDKNDILIFR